MVLQVLSPLTKTAIKKAQYVAPKIEVQILESHVSNIEQQVGDFIKIKLQQKIQCFKERLMNVLQSEYCEMPEYLSLIPKNATEEETIQALKQLFEDSKFFSRVSTCEKNYGKNFNWAKMMSQLAKDSSKSISQERSFEDVIKQISTGYAKASPSPGSGIYRGNNKPKSDEWWDIILRKKVLLGTFYYNNGREVSYKEYLKRLNANLARIISPYKNFTLTRNFSFEKDSPFRIRSHARMMVHPYDDEVAKNMVIISERYKLYQNLVKEYKINGKLTSEQKKQADDIISEIYYLMAHSCPFNGGSNGISDVLMRSQYSVLGMNKPHVRKGVGLDLEAFCMNLDEYKINWNDFFEL